MCGANKTLQFSQISTGRARRWELTRRQNNTKRDGVKKEICEAVGKLSASRRHTDGSVRRRGSGGAAAHTKSRYLLTQAIFCTMSHLCVCSLVCAAQMRCTVKWWCWGWGGDLSSAGRIHKGTFRRCLGALTPFLRPFLCPFLPSLGHLVSFCQTHTLVLHRLFTCVDKLSDRFLWNAIKLVYWPAGVSSSHEEANEAPRNTSCFREVVKQKPKAVITLGGVASAQHALRLVKSNSGHPGARFVSRSRSRRQQTCWL